MLQSDWNQDNSSEGWERCVSFHFSASLIDTLSRIPISIHGEVMWTKILLFKHAFNQLSVTSRWKTNSRWIKRHKTWKLEDVSTTGRGDPSPPSFPVWHSKRPKQHYWPPNPHSRSPECQAAWKLLHQLLRIYCHNSKLMKSEIKGVTRGFCLDWRRKNTSKQVALTPIWPIMSKLCWRTSLERADPGRGSPPAELLAGWQKLARGQPAPAPQN